MRKITDFIKKFPKPLKDPRENRTVIRVKKISWYYYILFSIFYLFGMNVFFTKNYFLTAVFIKIFWLIFLIFQLNQTVFSFAEGFIFYTICMSYLFHFFDIFLLFFFAIFLPNGQRLLEE